MKKIQTWVIHTFEFSRTEANGFIVLMIVMAVVVSLPPLTQVYFEKKYDSFTSDKKLLDSLVLVLESQNLKKVKKADVIEKASLLYIFNPNTCTVKDLKSLGFSPLARKSLISYRNKGGLFKSKTDLQKIYGVEEKFYEKIAPFIDLPNKVASNKSPKTYPEYSKQKHHISPPLLLDINIADTAEFEKLKGIGFTLSRRIIKYRNKLGGFFTIQQIREVYGIDSVLFNNISTTLIVKDTSRITRIFINTVTFEVLSSHPYMSKKNANIILNYRNQHGDYISDQDFLKIKNLKHEEILKILPYLNFTTSDSTLKKSPY